MDKIFKKKHRKLYFIDLNIDWRLLIKIFNKIEYMQSLSQIVIFMSKTICTFSSDKLENSLASCKS